jgi:hypothetical protein
MVIKLTGAEWSAVLDRLTAAGQPSKEVAVYVNAYFSASRGDDWRKRWAGHYLSFWPLSAFSRLSELALLVHAIGALELDGHVWLWPSEG